MHAAITSIDTQQQDPMPPKRSTRKAAAPPPAPPPLDGLHIAISGSISGFTQAEVKSLIAELGGVVDSSVTAKTTHVVTSQADFAKPSAKVKNAQDKGLPIVQVGWLTDSKSSGSKEDEKSYLFGTAAQPAAQVSSVFLPQLMDGCSSHQLLTIPFTVIPSLHMSLFV